MKGSRKKVKTKRSGFFYDGRFVRTGTELEVPKDVAANWIETGLADGVEPERKAQTRKPRAVAPTERTVAPGPAETRGNREDA